MGRRLKLTPQLQAAFCKHIETGKSIEAAAALCDVSRSIVFDWIAKGRAGKGQRYSDFSDAVEKADGKQEAMDLDNITLAAAQGSWQASAWRLERRHPKRYARRVYKPEDAAVAPPTVIFNLPALVSAAEAKSDPLLEIPDVPECSTGNGNGGTDG